MSNIRIRIPTLLWLLLFYHSMGSVAHAAGWIDNFDDGNVVDGNPVTWVENLAGLFPGTYDASSGDYRLGNAQNSSGTMVAFVPDVSFADTYIRAQGVLLPNALPAEDAGHLGILGRIDTSFLSTYLLFVDARGLMGLQRTYFGSPVDLTQPVQLNDIDSTSDVIVELDIVGNRLSGYAWRPGTSKPELPQITATEDVMDALAEGPAGIAYAEFQDMNDHASALYRFVAAQDRPFDDGVPGDYNDNGVVDAADYVLWRDGGLLANEVISPGTATPEDYMEWRARFGNSNTGSGNSFASAALAPEPSVVILTIFVLAACGLGRNRYGS